MKPANPWVAAFFCAFLCILKMVSQTMGSEPHRSHPFDPAFYSFLPMCFVYIAILMKQMQTELADLKRELNEVKSKPSELPT